MADIVSYIAAGGALKAVTAVVVDYISGDYCSRTGHPDSIPQIVRGMTVLNEVIATYHFYSSDLVGDSPDVYDSTITAGLSGMNTSAAKITNCAIPDFHIAAS